MISCTLLELGFVQISRVPILRGTLGHCLVMNLLEVVLDTVFFCADNGLGWGGEHGSPKCQDDDQERCFHCEHGGKCRSKSLNLQNERQTWGGGQGSLRLQATRV